MITKRFTDILFAIFILERRYFQLM